RAHALPHHAVSIARSTKRKKTAHRNTSSEAQASPAGGPRRASAQAVPPMPPVAPERQAPSPSRRPDMNRYAVAGWVMKAPRAFGDGRAGRERRPHGRMSEAMSTFGAQGAKPAPWPPAPSSPAPRRVI